MRPLPLLILLVVPLVPAASSMHFGCVPMTQEATVSTSLVHVLLTGRHVYVYEETNGIPGLQRLSACDHARDVLLADVCDNVDTRPVDLLCVVDLQT